jgi:predicted nuclease with TOPRIM domain
MFEGQLEHANSILAQTILKRSNAVSASAMLVTQFMPNNSVKAGIDDMERMRVANKAKLEAKLLKLRGKRQEIVESIEYLNLNLSELQEKLDGQRPELIELRKKRENYHMWLLQRGENEEKIQTVIEPGENLNKQNKKRKL